MENWRLLPLRTNDGPTNMAIDEAVLQARTENLVPNTLRFFRWNPSTATIGRNQSLSTEINMDAAKTLNIDVVRRISGGGAVYHDFNNEITYSVVSSERDLKKSFNYLRSKNGDTEEKFFDVDGSYEVIIQGLMNGLGTIGLKVEQGLIHCPVMLVDDLKISGNAQARRKGFILQHGTILLQVDAELMYTILKAPEGATKSKMVRSVRAKVTGLYDHEGVEPVSDADFQKTMVESFERKLNIKCEPGALTDYEKKLVEKYKIKRYSNKDWLCKFP